jgi:formate hydrogenlyase transcriptional activator
MKDKNKGTGAMSAMSLRTKWRSNNMSTVTSWTTAARAVHHNASFEIEAPRPAQPKFESNEGRSEFPRIISASAALRGVLDMVRIVAPTDATVLINGETGTGKELIAEAIHKSSRRSTGAFVKVNCAAIPAGLLESEMFGHERGAFTGAVAQRIGRFETASRGTVFLDEIGEIPLELQPKLLRVLQEKQFERLGGGRTLQVDVRIVAATNQDLWRMVQERKFRADLYYRLNVFPITLPPLRERGDDIRLLIEHFVQVFAKRFGKSIDRIPAPVMEVLKCHDWPGNIRELQNVIERAVIRTAGPVLELRTAELMTQNVAAIPIGTFTDAEQAPIKKLVDAERAHITATLHETNWVVGGPRGAASQLGLPRTTLIARMQRLGISGQRTGHPNQQFASVSGARSDAADRTAVETRACGHSPCLRDDSKADFRTMEAAACGTLGMS